jgi:hypothetical protein
MGKAGQRGGELRPSMKRGDSDHLSSIGERLGDGRR